jgi:hypothetical protein
MLRPFNFRTLVSLLLGWCFLSLIVSGAVLFISPAGRIANWTGWTLVGLRKDQWQAIHVIVATAFLVIGGFHLLKFNWRPFVHYLSVRGRQARTFYRELTISLTLAVVFVAGSAAGWIPFSFLMQGGERAKQYWDVPQDQPPVPHMELLTLDQIGRRLDIGVLQLTELLREEGIAVEGPEANLKTLASRAGLPPSVLFRRLVGRWTERSGAAFQPVESWQGAGSSGGMGRKTVLEVSQDQGVPVETILARLRSRGIQAAPDETLRAISQRHQLRPGEVADLVRQD